MDILSRDADGDEAIAPHLAALAGDIAVTRPDLPRSEPECRRRAVAAAAYRVFGNAVTGGKAAHHHPVAIGGVKRRTGPALRNVIGGKAGFIVLQPFQVGDAFQFGNEPDRTDIDRLCRAFDGRSDPCRGFRIGQSGRAGLASVCAASGAASSSETAATSPFMRVALFQARRGLDRCATGIGRHQR